jgi:hypothetical protein
MGPHSGTKKGRAAGRALFLVPKCGGEAAPSFAILRRRRKMRVGKRRSPFGNGASKCSWSTAQLYVEACRFVQQITALAVKARFICFAEGETGLQEFDPRPADLCASL